MGYDATCGAPQRGRETVLQLLRRFRQNQRLIRLHKEQHDIRSHWYGTQGTVYDHLRLPIKHRDKRHVFRPYVPQVAEYF